MNLSKTYEISKLRILILALIVAVLGTALTLYSHAATNYSLQAKLEAEGLTIPSGVGRIIADSGASNGKAVKFIKTGSITSSTFTTTDTTVKVEVVARNHACAGDAHMYVYVDGHQQGSMFTVSPTSWSTYSINTNIPAGNHTLSVKYPNSYFNSSCIRNLFIDKVSFFANTPLPSDTTKPTVTISSPADGSTISGSVTASATANDNVSVSKVEFYVDNTLVSTSLTAPYSFTTSSANLAAGVHTITAKAYDPAGNVGNASVMVNVPGTTSTTPTPTTGLNKGYFPNATAFTAPITNPVIRSDSTAFMQEFIAGNFWNPNMTLRGYGVSIVYGTGAFTAYPAPPPGENSQYIGSAGKMQVPKVPAGTQPAAGTDGHLAVIVGTTVYEIYKATVSADGTITNAKAVARADLNGNGQTNKTDAPSDAAGISLLAGIITPQELASGHIDHALAFSVPGIKSGSPLFPAWENVYVGNSNTVLVEGSKIQLDPNANISGLPEPQKTIAKALQTYGAYLRDNGGTFSIYGVSSNQWPASFGTASSLGIGQIPWSQIRVIQGPTQ